MKTLHLKSDSAGVFALPDSDNIFTDQKSFPPIPFLPSLRTDKDKK
jgi:hypothetical protein